MATSNCIIAGQNFNSTSYGTESAYCGFNYGSIYYAYILKFTTPAFAGMPQSITFNLRMYSAVKNESRVSTFSARWAVCSSDANFSLYKNTKNDVTDTNQLNKGIQQFTGLSTAGAVVSLTVSTGDLAPNTPYYLIMWGDGTGGDSQYYAEIDSPSAHTVSLAYINTYTLSIAQGAGSSIVVKRNGTALGNGATVTYGDKLVISFSANTGYELTSHTVNGSGFASGGTHTVTGNVSVVSTAKLRTFLLFVSVGTGAAATVTRGGTALGNGATVTYGDKLVISFSAEEKYSIDAHTVNGVAFASGGIHTVTGDVAVVVTAKLMAYLLSIAETGCLVSVQRDGEALADGAQIVYGEVLKILFTAKEGRGLISHTVNGVAFASGGTHTVTGDVSVVGVAQVLAYPVGDGLYHIYVGDGAGGSLYVAYVGGENNEPVPLGTV